MEYEGWNKRWENERSKEEGRSCEVNVEVEEEEKRERERERESERGGGERVMVGSSGRIEHRLTTRFDFLVPQGTLDPRTITM